MSESKNSVFDMLNGYAQSMPARFHMPGHKGNGLQGLDLCALDVTEISKTDDLTAPFNALSVLENRFAKAYRAKHSFLLVNGSTSGIHTFLLALGTNKKIVVSRECHRSVIHGAALCDHELLFTKTQDADEIKAAFLKAEADAVILTSPTYYGKCADAANIADFVHEKGGLIFVDAAHGAHFPFSDKLPEFEHEKVDMWCVSTHKTLNSFTQSAILNIGISSPFEQEYIRRLLMMENTSSPSFLLMLSLENALNCAMEENVWDEHIVRIEAFKKRMESELLHITAKENDDITRLCIDVTKIGVTGYEASKRLEKAQIFIECANAENLVLITTPSDKDEWYERLLNALKELDKKSSADDAKPKIREPNDLCKKRMSIREAVFSEYEYIELEKSVGRISAVCLGVYPPGSAVVAPGEEISNEVMLYLKAHNEIFLDVYGIFNGSVPCVKE